MTRLHEIHREFDCAGLLSQNIYCYFQPTEMTAKTAVVFPGHGSQYPRMLMELWESNKTVRSVFDQADRGYQEVSGEKLSHLMFANDGPHRKPARERINMPTVMQPAIFTAGVAMFRIVKELGVEPSFLVGHSLGELAAWCSSGSYSVADGVKLAYFRAKALETISVDRRGGMIAVHLSPDNVALESILRTPVGYMEKTLHNSPDQTIISATEDALQVVRDNCQRAKVRCTDLPVSHAFHSALMRPAVAVYKQAIGAIEFHAPAIPIVSTIDHKIYDKANYSTLDMADFLSRQLVTPFSFCNIIQELHLVHGIYTFIESGPGNILTKLIRRILKGKEFCAVESNAAKGRDTETLYKLKTCLAINRKPVEEQTMLMKSEQLHDGMPGTIGPAKRMVADVDGDLSGADTKDSSATDGLDIETVVYSLFATATGYPRDMLDPAFDLEADLGIDSVKQGDILSRIAEKFSIPSDTDVSGYELNTISKIIEWLSVTAIGPQAPAAAETQTGRGEEENIRPATARSVSEEELSATVYEVFEQATGYPRDMLNPDFDLEADLGIDSVKQGDSLTQLGERLNLIAGDDITSRDLSTIAKILDYLRQAVSGNSQGTPEQVNDSTQNDETVERVVRLVHRKTGYPRSLIAVNASLHQELAIPVGLVREIVRESVGALDYPSAELRRLSVTRLASGVKGSDGVIPEYSPLATLASLKPQAEAATRYVPITVEKPLNREPENFTLEKKTSSFWLTVPEAPLPPN